MSDERVELSEARPAGWEKRLGEYLARFAGEPFLWGARDCVTFTAGAAEAVLDWPAGEALGGLGIEPWGSKSEALRALAERGGLEAAVQAGCAALGFEEWWAPRKAQRGDIVLVETEGGATVGIVALDGRLALLDEEGSLEFYPAIGEDGEGLAKRAWRVG
jgi:hypothetical protein